MAILSVQFWHICFLALQQGVIYNSSFLQILSILYFHFRNESAGILNKYCLQVSEINLHLCLERRVVEVGVYVEERIRHLKILWH